MILGKTCRKIFDTQRFMLNFQLFVRNLIFGAFELVEGINFYICFLTLNNQLCYGRGSGFL